MLFQRSVLHPVVVDSQVLEICAGEAPPCSLRLGHLVQLAQEALMPFPFLPQTAGFEQLDSANACWIRRIAACAFVKVADEA